MTEATPDKALPRDETGSYLHLKLKRFKTIKDLTMPYAKKTWTETPQDAEVDISPSGRSSCRQCHSKIEKGDIRMRLWLQCHKGCKNSAYFHEECFWNYPETEKLESVDELVGFEDLSSVQQSLIKEAFEKLKDTDPEQAAPAKKKRKV